MLAEPGRVLADPGREGDAEEVDVAEDGRALVAEPGRSAASAGWLSPIRCIHAGVGAGCFFFTGAELGRSLRGSARRTGAEAGRLAGRPPLALVLTLGRIGGRLEDIAATLSLFSLTVIVITIPMINDHGQRRLKICKRGRSSLARSTHTANQYHIKIHCKVCAQQNRATAARSTCSPAAVYLGTVLVRCRTGRPASMYRKVTNNCTASGKHVP